jgi:hypothetical protein
VGFDVLADTLASMIRRAVMYTFMITDLQAHQVAFAALQSTHLDRSLDVVGHMLELAI